MIQQKNMMKFFQELKKKSKHGVKGGKELFYEKNYARIGINTDDDVPSNKPLKFPTLTIIIRCVFQEAEKMYPQICLDECLYKNVRIWKN